MNVVTTTIKSRHSVRKFKEKPLDDTVVRDVFTCAALAPTAINIQPWLFGCVRDRQILKNIADLTEHGKFIADAAACFAVFGEKDSTYYLEDCSAATENIILALQSYGFGSCWVAGDKKGYADAVRKILNVPEKYSLVSLIATGVPADIALVPKKEIDTITFLDRYG